MSEPVRFKLNQEEFLLLTAYLGGRQIRGMSDIFAGASVESTQMAWSQVMVSLAEKEYCKSSDNGELVIVPQLADALLSIGKPSRSVTMLKLSPAGEHKVFFNSLNRRIASFYPEGEDVIIQLHPSPAQAALFLLAEIKLPAVDIAEVGMLNRSALSHLQGLASQSDTADTAPLLAKLRHPEALLKVLQDNHTTVIIDYLMYNPSGQLTRQDTTELLADAVHTLKFSVLRRGEDPLYRITGFSADRLRREAELFFTA